MTTPESNLYPDTPITDVDIHRVAEILDQQQLKYRIEDVPSPEGDSAETTMQILRTGFANAAIAMQVRNNVLIIDSIWRGNIPNSEGHKVLSLTSNWNTQHFAPTLRFFESQGQTLAISGVRELNVTGGASRNQLGAFVMSTLNAVLESFSFIEQSYPELVTWQEPNHD